MDEQAMAAEWLPLVEYLSGRMQARCGRWSEQVDLYGAGMEALVKGLRRLPAGCDDVRSFLGRRIWFALVDELRANDINPRYVREGHPERVEVVPLVESACADFADAVNGRIDLQRRLRRLPERDRLVILAAAARYTQEEIGEALGVCGPRVSQMQRRARGRLAA